MIKVKKKILVLVAMLFAFIPFVNAEELGANETITNTINFDSTEIKELQDTTEGVTLVDDYKGGYDLIAYLTYTITEDIDIESTNGVLVLNFIKDIYDSNYFRYCQYVGLLPSSKIEIHLTIVNNTQYEFELKEGDLIISTAVYNYNEDSEGKKVETFDGNTVDVTSKYNINRSTNLILKELLGKDYLNDSDVSDDNIANVLKNIKNADGTLKYPNGIDDLDDYYLDYFNRVNNRNYTSLSDLTDDELCIILGTVKHGLQQGANATSVLESNSNIARIGYDYFYNRVVTVVPEDSLTEKYNKDYSVGEYMRNNAPDKLENQVKEYVNNMNDKTETVITSYLYGYAGNSYQGFTFGLNIAARITTKKYKVVAKYVDEDGKELTTAVVEEYLDGKEYKTEEKTFEGYELIEVKGERTGTINKEDVEVIYIYQFVLGEGGDEKEEEPTNLVQTGSEVDYSLMTSALITVSLMAIALKTKKKNN